MHRNIYLDMYGFNIKYQVYKSMLEYNIYTFDSVTSVKITSKYIYFYKCIVISHVYEF